MAHSVAQLERKLSICDGGDKMLNEMDFEAENTNTNGVHLSS